MKAKKNIKGFVDKRAKELYLEWKKKASDLSIENRATFEGFRLDALIEYLENAD